MWYNIRVHKIWKGFSNCQINLKYNGCNSPVYLCFRQLQQLGRDYRMAVTVHLQIENETEKCRLKSEAKNIKEQKIKLSEPLELFWSVKNLHRISFYLMLQARSIHVLKRLTCIVEYWCRPNWGRWIIYFFKKFIQICLWCIFFWIYNHCIIQYLLKCTCICSRACQ